MADHNLTTLVNWVENRHGYIHPDVEIRYDNDKGYQVFAKNHIKAGTRVLSCPLPCSLSVLNAMHIAPFQCWGTRFPEAFTMRSPTAASYFFLMDQEIRGSDSFWAPYIRTLPGLEFLDDMLEPDERWIAGTNLKLSIIEQLQKWKAMYEAANEQLVRLKFPNAIAGKYSWRRFLWAATMFSSRSFTSQVLSDSLPAAQAATAGREQPRHEELSKLFSEGFPVLLPVLDLLNYKIGAQVDWQARATYIGLQVRDNYNEGEEIFNNYGPRDNGTLLLSYGFAIPDNRFDHYTVGLPPPPGSPIPEIRSWDKTKKPEDYKCYIFHHQHPRAVGASYLEVSLFSFDLLDTLSGLCANDRELQEISVNKKSYMTRRLAKNSSPDNRLLLATHVQLYSECQKRLSMLIASDPTSAGGEAGTPTNQKQRYAKMYRDGQVQILETAMELCRYTIGYTTTDRGLLSPVEGTAHLARGRVQNLDAMHKKLLEPSELILYTELVSQSEELTLLFPETMQGYLKLRLVSAVASIAEDSAVVKSARVNGWLKCALTAYPLDDPNWSKMQGEERPEHQLIKQVPGKHRVWAWNVVEQESVFVPPGILKDGAEMFLYVSHYLGGGEEVMR